MESTQQSLQFVEGRLKFLLTVALLSISTKFKTWMTHTAKGTQHVDTTMGTLGMARAALINVYKRQILTHFRYWYDKCQQIHQDM